MSMRMRRPLLAFKLFPLAGLWLLLACQPEAPAPPTAAQAIHGFWLTNVDSDAMYSRDSLAATVDRAVELGFNAIYAVTWNRGYTLYPSAVMDSLTGIPIDPALAGRDPLTELVELAHAQGLKVYAWFEFGFAAAYGTQGIHLLDGRPHWRALDGEGQLAVKNGFAWMNAFHPEVQALLTDLILEVATRYEVDGIQGDDRLPALPSLAGYEPYTRALYQAEHDGAEPPSDYRDPEWVQWRADRLSDYLHGLYDTLKAVRPDLIVSMAPSIYPWSKEEYLQDWPRWLAEGWVDEVCPQIYRYDIDRYIHELDKIVQAQVGPGLHHRLAPGILLKVGDYYASQGLLDSMIQANRARGIEGEVFFFYEGIRRHEAYFREAYP